MTTEVTAHTSPRALVERCARHARALRTLSGENRAEALHRFADSIRRSSQAIVHANQQDLHAAQGLSSAMIDRLTLDSRRIESMASAVDSIADQPDPIGEVVIGRLLPGGLKLEKRRVPIGVIFVIYESRPNVTADAAALCIKSGNAVVLKGGREALNSNRAIAGCLVEPLAEIGAENAACLVERTDRDIVIELLQMDDLIDLTIPRGGPGLMRTVVDAARMPVVKHDAGICHLFIDEHLEGLEDAAIEIAVNAKTQRPGVCNAIETLLIHEGQADRMLPALGRALQERAVEIRGDERTCRILPGCAPAAPEDWRTEYLDLILSIRVVDSLEDACEHIREFGSAHTDAIVTSSIDAARRFVAELDSASVMVNCSTRFADGGEYGLGAEIGISTEKLHARGPMGASDLTTYQWVVEGRGQIRR